MGAYAYCRNCGSGMDIPTLADSLKRRIVCDCGEKRPLEDYEYEAAIDEVVSRLEKLERG